MKRCTRIIIIVVLVMLVGFAGCNWFDRKTPDSPTGPVGSAVELGNYAQQAGQSQVVTVNGAQQQINWVVSEWGSLPYGYWVYVEVNQQDAVGQPPGEHQVPVTLGTVVLSFSDLPDEVTQILIGVKAVHDDTDDTFIDIGRFAAVDGSVSIPLAYADLIYYFGVTHYSIWFQALGGENGEGLACGQIALSGVMPGGQNVNFSKRVCVGTNPALTPSPAPTTPTVADTDGDGVPDASDNCPTVPNPHQRATDDDTATCRFIDNTDGTVTDMTTGKMWERRATYSDYWYTGHCRYSTLGGYTDWGLPTRAEFQDLIDPSQRNPALPSGHPFLVISAHFWTLEEYDWWRGWGVYLRDGHEFFDDKGLDYFIWCVRP